MFEHDFESKTRAFQESRILLTAIELDLFSSLGTGAAAEEAALNMGTDLRATEMLLNALAAMGLVEKRGTMYVNSELAARLLVDSSPENVRQSFLHDANRWHTWSSLTDRVRGAVQPDEYSAMPASRHRDLLAMLDRRSAQRAPKLVEAIGVSEAGRILDIGGGSAAYSIAFARASTKVEAEILELPEVAPVTEEYIARAGLGDRIRTRTGDFRSCELGEGFDLVLLFSITHLLGSAENQSLLARCCSALNPGGRLAIHDHILDEDKTHPRAGAIFAINMLVATPNGGTYSFEEYSSWLLGAGFASVERRPLVDAPTGVVIGTR